MLWHASTEPQRRQPCGEAGVAIIGQPAFATGSDTLHPGRWRT